MLLRIGDASINIEPDFLFVILQMLEDFTQGVFEVKRSLEFLELEVGTVCGILRDEAHVKQDFLHFFDAVSVKDPSLQ